MQDTQAAIGYSAFMKKRANTALTAIPSKQLKTLAVTIALIAYIAIAIKSAWVADDAYFTFRTIDNWVSGYGLRWNIIERVQVYTHPLWMLFLAAAYRLTHEIWLTSMIVSLITSAGAVIIVCLKIARTIGNSWLAAASLIASKAFIDYSTSGLENPLLYLLLALFYALYFYPLASARRHLLALSFITALLAMTRLDAVALVAPALLWVWWTKRHTLAWLTAAWYIGLGFIPFILWTAFSVIYYGFPLPNTAYAKLFATSVPAGQLWQQGWRYIGDSLNTDPVTLLIIVVAGAATYVMRRLDLAPLYAGIAVSLLYTISIGGDFMSGRFLSAPFFCAVMILVHIPWPQRIAGAASVGVLAASLIAAPFSPLRTSSTFDLQKPFQHYQTNNGITDERAFYYQRTGLLSPAAGPPQQGHAGRKVRALPINVQHHVQGIAAFMAGPRAHVINIWAITDPLLARLPIRTDMPWRIGHFERTVPGGYAASVEQRQNKICDPALARYYDSLTLATQSPLWSAQRWRAIWQLNTGQLNSLLAEYNPQHQCSEENR